MWSCSLASLTTSGSFRKSGTSLRASSEAAMRPDRTQVVQTPSPREGTRTFQVVVSVVVAVMAAQYVAGCLLQISLGLSVSEASLLTIVRYGYYYRDTPEMV